MSSPQRASSGLIGIAFWLVLDLCGLALFATGALHLVTGASWLAPGTLDRAAARELAITGAVLMLIAAVGVVRAVMRRQTAQSRH